MKNEEKLVIVENDLLIVGKSAKIIRGPHKGTRYKFSIDKTIYKVRMKKSPKSQKL